MVNQASEIITILDRDGRVLYENAAIYTVLGYTADERIGADPFDLIHADDVASVQALFNEVISSPSSRSTARFRFRHKDGSWRWLEAVGTNLLADPDVGGMVITSRDITDRQRMEAQLIRNEQHNRELHAAEQRRAQELALLGDVSAALAEELDLPILFRTVVEGIAQTCGYSLVSLYLLENDVLVLQHQVGYDHQIAHIPVSEGVAGRAVRTGKPVLIPDVRSDPTFLGAIPGIVSEICVPLQDHGLIAGVLNVECRDEVPLADRDLRLVEALGQHVSVALGRGRLYTDVRQSEARLQALLQHAEDMISVVDAEGRRTSASPAYEHVLGYHPDDLVGQSIAAICFPEDVEHVQKRFADFIQNPFAKERFETRVRHHDGSPRWLEIIAVNRLWDPVVGGVVVTSRDVTERRANEVRLRHQAHHDPLTGLPNRTLFFDQLRAGLSRSQARHITGGVTLLFLDLDGFKAVNDTYGHGAGDRLLREAAQRLADCVRPGDVLARFGGDEFVILLAGSTNPEVARAIAERLVDCVATPYEVDGHCVDITASVGIVCASGNIQPHAVLQAADEALYRAKAAGKGTVAISHLVLK